MKGLQVLLSQALRDGVFSFVHFPDFEQQLVDATGNCCCTIGSAVRNAPIMINTDAINLTELNISYFFDLLLVTQA